MGRGGGCAPGKLAFGKKGKAVDPGVGSQQDVAQPMDEANEGVVPQAAHDETVSGGGGGVAAADAAAVTPKATTTTTTTAPNLKLFVVYYSTYGHVAALAQKVKEGADSVEGVEGYLYQVPETLSDDVLSKMSAPTKDSSVPIISAQELTEADAIIFGFPTRYGSMAAQMKAFFDSTGNLWRGQSLAGKPAGFFFSTGTQGGGQETTAWTAITQLAHHGMLFVPIGYTFGAGMFKMDEIRGGSPYGAGTYAGDGSRTPNETELAMAVHQGRYTAGIVKGISGQGLSKA